MMFYGHNITCLVLRYYMFKIKVCNCYNDESMKKLILVNPLGRKSGFLLSKITRFQPLGLGYVAACTPSDWQVKILDENIEPCSFEDADLVGITAFTSSINRAYEIAETYRQRGTKVVMGGIHVSMLPDEALKYVDSVVIGEAEGVWDRVIKDWEDNRLQPKYTNTRIDLGNNHIRPRRDLFHPDYFWQSVQTSRGCPFNCSFCSVTNYLGPEYRQRTYENVLDELKDIKGKYITFVDDNLIGHNTQSKTRAKKLFQGMVDLKLSKKWWMQASINTADDDELIRLAAKAGCLFVFIGFETIEKRSLKAMKKGINLKTGVNNYKTVVKAFHRHGIGVLGAFILGNDYESDAYYRELANFMVHSGIDVFQTTFLTPLPGTDLMRQLEHEGRLVHKDFPHDWDKYRLSYVVHQPTGVDADTIYRGTNYIKDHLYSFPWYYYRLAKSFLSVRKPVTCLTVRKLNESYKRAWHGAQYKN